MVGIDIIAVSRFSRIKKLDYKHWLKFFTKAEWQYSFARPDPAQTLAGVYAAKEAVMKALGRGLLGRADRIEIGRAAGRRPIVKIDKKKDTKISVSISHTEGIAAAVAVKYE